MPHRAPQLPKERLSDHRIAANYQGIGKEFGKGSTWLASQAASGVEDEQDASGWLQTEELEPHLPEIGLTAQEVSGTHLRLLRADNTTSGLVGFGCASVPVTIPDDTDSNLSFTS